jgi:hypothetical protein
MASPAPSDTQQQGQIARLLAAARDTVACGAVLLGRHRGG